VTDVKHLWITFRSIHIEIASAVIVLYFLILLMPLSGALCISANSHYLSRLMLFFIFSNSGK
jgi:cytochrome b561